MAEDNDMAEDDDFDTNDEDSSGPADQAADLSIVEIDPENFFANRRPSAIARKVPGQTQEESLEVDMSSFALSASSRRGNQSDQTRYQASTAGPSRSRPHPTARVLDSDMFSSSKQSKYFGASHQSRHIGPINDMHENIPVKRSRTNPFQSDKADTERKKVLPSGQSTSHKYEILDLAGSDDSASDSGHPREPKRKVFKATDSNISRTGSGSSIGSSVRGVAGSTGSGKQKSMAEFLGLADKHGRPNKGVVGGAKVKRRA